MDDLVRVTESRLTFRRPERLVARRAQPSSTLSSSKAQRDEVLTAAIEAGKFTEARRGQYDTLLQRDFDGTKAWIDRLVSIGSAASASKSVPSSSAAIAPASDDPPDDAYPADWAPGVRTHALDGQTRVVEGWKQAADEIPDSAVLRAGELGAMEDASDDDPYPRSAAPEVYPRRVELNARKERLAREDPPDRFARL